jgi:hypothetical protein
MRRLASNVEHRTRLVECRAFMESGRRVCRSGFVNQADAIASLVKGNMKMCEPYRCSRGHWHLGKKLKRPIVTRDPT